MSGTADTHVVYKEDATASHSPVNINKAQFGRKRSKYFLHTIFLI